MIISETPNRIITINNKVNGDKQDTGWITLILIKPDASNSEQIKLKEISLSPEEQQIVVDFINLRIQTFKQK